MNDAQAIAIMATIIYTMDQIAENMPGGATPHGPITGNGAIGMARKFLREAMGIHEEDEEE